jgi:hypothetical protein
MRLCIRQPPSFVGGRGSGMSSGPSNDDDAGNSQHRELLEWIVLRMLVIADRCQDPAVRYEMMQLVDQLVGLIEDDTQSPRAPSDLI